MINRLYEYRFDIFLVVQLLLLFGILLFPHDLYVDTLTPILYLINILAGILMISKKRKAMWFCIILFALSLLIFGDQMFSKQQVQNESLLIRLGIYFVFNVVVTWNIVSQVWREKSIDRKLIIGLICGYISLGFLGFFLFMSIDITHPGSFAGGILNHVESFALRSDSLLYFSFITLLTIGYGDIVPAIPIAQKAAILVGLIGQFYMVIITAVVLEKYIRQSHQDDP